MRQFIGEYHYNFYLAVLLHVLVLIIVGMNVYALQKVDHEATSIRAYIYQDKGNRLQVTDERIRTDKPVISTRLGCRDVACSVSTKTAKQEKVIILHHHDTKHQHKNNKETNNLKIKTPVTRNLSPVTYTNTSENTNQLLELLHTAIAKAQSYPQQALILNQHGTVTVSFVLAPQGKINAVTVVKSSGYSSLDAAAIDAVVAINPFKEASQYIKREEKMKVEIVFAG